MSKTIEITTDNIDEILSSKKLVILDFWATWCGPCKMYSPIIESFANEKTSDDVLVGKIDCDEQKDLVAKYSVKSIPTTIVLKGSEVVERKTGIVSENDLNEILLKHTA